ncbi:MAG: translational GTPase TypA [Pseudomonadota bacterium]
MSSIRNIAIIAHVDHGKTTLVDQLLRQSGTVDARADLPERAMDSGDLERERGITILSKNTAVTWRDYRINIVDTPGHADFGGEVERVLSMVDSVLLLVDAVEGPMPQTRFVTRKAFDLGLKPIVVINKMDRPGARPGWVLDQTFDLFDRLGASEDQLDFSTVYASAIAGQAGVEPDALEDSLDPLFQVIVDEVPPPPVDPDGDFQMQISTLDYSTYVGVIGIGRIARGRVAPNMPITVVDRDGASRNARVLQVLGLSGLERVEMEGAAAGDIIAISGIEGLGISETLCPRGQPDPLSALTVDEPTITMSFRVNTSPFAGREGKYLTSRQIRERLMREASYNVALRVADTPDPDVFQVSGRGELHLAVLIETMRREQFEIAISRPRVVQKEVDGVLCEPFEELVVDLAEAGQGAVMQRLGERRGEVRNISTDNAGRVRLEYLIPSRGLIGFQSEFRTLTAGEGLMHHRFERFAPRIDEPIAPRKNGVLISNSTGKALAYALFNLQERGRMMIDAGESVYEGQVIGQNSRGNDLTVNPLKGKQLTNIRAAGKDDAILLTPPVKFSLEQAMEYIEDDELVEVTPASLRVRKALLTESERKRAARSGSEAP